MVGVLDPAKVVFAADIKYKEQCINIAEVKLKQTIQRLIYANATYGYNSNTMKKFLLPYFGNHTVTVLSNGVFAIDNVMVVMVAPRLVDKKTNEDFLM